MPFSQTSQNINFQLSNTEQGNKARHLPQTHATFLNVTPQKEGQGAGRHGCCVENYSLAEINCRLKRGEMMENPLTSVRTSPSTHRLPRKSFCHAMPDGGKI